MAYTCTYMYIQVYIYIYIQVYSYLYVWVCVSMHVCIKWPIEYPSICSMETWQEPFFISHLFDAGHIVSRHMSTADSHSPMTARWYVSQVRTESWCEKWSRTPSRGEHGISRTLGRGFKKCQGPRYEFKNVFVLLGIQGLWWFQDTIDVKICRDF